MKKVINGIIVNKKHYTIRKDGNKLSDRKASKLVKDHVKTISYKDRDERNAFYGLFSCIVGKHFKSKIILLEDVKNFVVKC